MALSPRIRGGISINSRLKTLIIFSIFLTLSSGQVSVTHEKHGIPLSPTLRGQSHMHTAGLAFTEGGSRIGVPLPPPTAGTGGRSSGSKFTTLGVTGPVYVPSVGRGIQETRPQGGPRGGTTFHINDLPSSIELDKNLSPVPPYFVFADDDSSEGALTIGGPKTGALVPVSNPGRDPNLLRLLSQPIVRQRLVSEANADHALKITTILMAHRQVVGGQITYASLKMSETNCTANRVNSLWGCSVEPSADSYVCEVAFWERPWLNVTRILDEKTACAATETDVEFDEGPESDSPSERTSSGQTSLRGVVHGDEVGGVWTATNELPSGLNAQQLAVEAFSYVDAHSDSSYRGYLADHSVHSIMADSTRNLTKVYVLVDYGFTLCLRLDWNKGGQRDPRNCPVDEARPVYRCALTLLYHPSQLMPLRVIHSSDERDKLTCTKQLATNGVQSAAAAHLTSSGNPDHLQQHTKRDSTAQCSGCPTPVALSDPTVLSILKFAVEEYDKLYTDDDDGVHKPVSLLAAYSQATAGTKYVLTVEVAETVCHKKDSGRHDCPPKVGEEHDICLFVLLHQPWLPSTHLLSARCVDKDEAHKLDFDGLSPSSAELLFHTGDSRPSARQNEQPLSLSNLKPVSLTLTESSTGQLNAQQIALMQVVLDYVNSAQGHDSWRLDDDSRENPFDDSRELDVADSDVVYQLVKVHKFASLPGQQSQHRLVLELGETNCSRSILPRQSSTTHCSLDPFEEHEVCDAVVSTHSTAKLLSITCEDLGDYLEQSSLLPPVPSVTWVPSPFIPVGHFANNPHTFTGYSSSASGPYANMAEVSTTSDEIKKAGELVVARYNLLSGEDELATLTQILSAHTQETTGGTVYLLEVEIAETRCKKYLPIIDQSKCPVDNTMDQIVCQAEVQQRLVTQAQTAWDGLAVNKLYCREKEQYHNARATGNEGPWTNMDTNSGKVKEVASFTADQYDLRSDDDELFMLSKILSARYQNASGVRYSLVLELTETVCPKYKEHINKARCRIDPSHDSKVCNAELFEPPSGQGLQLTSLQCTEQSKDGDSGSAEVLVLPRVHPSAHARPVFLSKFKKPRFRVRLDDSGESLESNEKFYRDPRPLERGGRAPGRRDDSRSHEEADSDEFLPSVARRTITRRRLVRSAEQQIGLQQHKYNPFHSKSTSSYAPQRFVPRTVY